MNDKIIIALDVNDLKSAQRLTEKLTEAVFFKVGLQAFLKFGPEIIEYLEEHHKKLFLDLKFKDIPHTVFAAVKSCLKFTPHFTTIHLSGGAEMIRKAVEAAGSSHDLTILGVTILTSLSNRDMRDIGSNLTTADGVLRLIELGLNNGLKAFVCSPQEVTLIRQHFGREPLLVTPGIRPAWAAKGDQKRVFTPKMAVEAGSDYLVIGRPISQHPDPALAFSHILAEMN